MARRWLAGLSLVVFAACATDEPTFEGTPPPQDTEPSVSISAPEGGATVEAGDIEVTLSVGSFDVVDKLGQPPVDGEGHVHFYIDVKEADLPTTPEQPAVTPDMNTYHATATTTHTWTDVEAGSHALCAQLVQNNHWPLEPAVTDCVTVTVE